MHGVIYPPRDLLPSIIIIIIIIIIIFTINSDKKTVNLALIPGTTNNHVTMQEGSEHVFGPSRRRSYRTMKVKS